MQRLTGMCLFLALAGCGTGSGISSTALVNVSAAEDASPINASNTETVQATAATEGTNVLAKPDVTDPVTPDPISGHTLRILMVSGGAFHGDYNDQSAAIREGLDQRLSIQWTEINYGAQAPDFDIPLYRKAGWATGYDLVIHNICTSHASDETADGLIQGHLETGVPAVALHCTSHSFTGSNHRAFVALLGWDSRTHRMSDQGAETAILVKKAIPSDIVAKIGDSGWRIPDTDGEEVYLKWADLPGGNTSTTLATAAAADAPDETPEPAIWTNEYNGIKVFGMTPGHKFKVMTHTQYLDTLARGIKWASGQSNQ